MQQSSLPGFEPPPRELHNLFFALWPDDATRAGIGAVAERLRLDQPTQGRWIKPSRYHLTLQFLGEYAALPADLVAKACTAAARVRVPGFDLTLDKIGSFGNAKIPCWLGCVQLPPGLQALSDGLGDALRGVGCRVAGSTQLVPHVTVLRDAQHALDLPLDPLLRWHVGEFVLIGSRIQPFAPYRILGRWPLG
jgi:2'-5' RNA ligase